MTHYFDPEQTDSLACFASLLESMLKKHTSFHDLVLLCIGSDRATGDSLGPLLGHRLQQGRLLKKKWLPSLWHTGTPGSCQKSGSHHPSYSVLPFCASDHRPGCLPGKTGAYWLCHIAERTAFPRSRRCQKSSSRRGHLHYRHRKLRRLQTPAAAADHVSGPSSRTGRLHPEWVISQPGLITAPSAPPMRGIRSSHQ